MYQTEMNNAFLSRNKKADIINIHCNINDLIYTCALYVISTATMTVVSKPSDMTT